MDRHLEEFLERYPFFALIRYGDSEYVCIIQNQDNDVTTIYDYKGLKTEQHKIDFIFLAEQWWWESNRSIPINIFLKTEWEPFRDCLKTFSNRDLEILHGPVCSLNDISRRKSKRRSITLVKKPY